MGYRSWKGNLVAMLHSWVDTTEKGLRRCWGLEKLPEEGVGKGSPRKGKGWKWLEIYETWGNIENEDGRGGQSKSKIDASLICECA